MNTFKLRRQGFGRAALLAAALPALFLSGCFSRGQVKGPGDEDWGVRVKWHGHSCFSFEDSAGRVFLVDPFDETVGYPLPRTQPDAILVTHAHFDHDYFAFRHFGDERGAPGGETMERPEAGRGTRRSPDDMPRARSLIEQGVLLSSGVSTVAGVEVTGIEGFHDDQGGRRHGKTNFYVWNMGGVRLAHLGDVGQSGLTPDQMRALGPVDVLFVPVGGKTTVDAARAAAIVNAVRPRVAVPMHYGGALVRFFEFDPVDAFAELFERVVKLDEDAFHLNRQNLPGELTVYVPAPPAEKK